MTRTRRRPTLAFVVVAASAVAVIFTLIGFAVVSDDDPRTPPTTDLLSPRDPGPIHVHGLGLNPKDGALFIATHTGLWRSGQGESSAQRVGESRQDTMGFTVVGPDRFLGSGHPDLQEARARDLPPNLGLIASSDGGASWEPISLLGEADFHVLRSKGRRIYAFDSTNRRLLLSRDEGRTWTERPPPGSLYDLAVHPGNPSHFVVTSERGLFASSNDGRAWQPLGNAVGLLAWPSPERLYLVAGDGNVFSSPDRGKRWTRVGTIGGQPAAFLAAKDGELYAALHDGTVVRTTNGGRSWGIRSRP